MKTEKTKTTETKINADAEKRQIDLLVMLFVGGRSRKCLQK